MDLILDSVQTGRGPTTAPAVFPDRCCTDDDSHAYTISDRAVILNAGLEKQIVDPAWNKRILKIAGRDLFGRPNFRATWGANETLHHDSELRFPHVASQWLLLRRFPASAWGSRQQWYAPRIDDGAWAPSYADTFGEEYPWSGGEEIFYAFAPGVRFCMPYVEHLLRQWLNRPKLPGVAQRMRDARTEIEAQEQAAWQADYERFTALTRPSLGEPWTGYGKKVAPGKSKAPVMSPSMHEQFKRIHAGRMARSKRRAAG